MRKHRYYSVSGNFRSGVLSPAAQDDITREDWLNGAAELLNFDILRDGGIRTRPRLIRDPAIAEQMPVLRRSVLGEAVPARPEGGWWFSTDPAQQGAGATPIDLAGSPFLELTLPGQNGYLSVRTLILSDVRLRQGPWSVGAGAGAELVFGVEITRDGNEWLATDTRTADGGDPYSRFAFAPGRVRRDVCVQIPRDESRLYRTLTGIRLRVKVDPATDNGAELALRTLELRIGDAAAYDDRPLASTEQARTTGDRAARFATLAAFQEGQRGVTAIPPDTQGWRMLPWTLRDLEMALVIGMEGMLVVGAPRGKRPWSPEIVVPRSVPWSFTRRQIRELTWCTYGSHLLLFHEEFPRPLEVRLSGTGQLAVSFLAMENVPQLPARLAPEARLDVRVDAQGQVVLDQPEPAVGAATRAVVPTSIRGTAGVSEIRLLWDDVGATRYLVYAQPEATYAALAEDTAWTAVAPTVVTTPAARLTGLIGGTEYRVAVVSVVDAGPNALAGQTDPSDADDLTLTVLRGALAAPVLAGVLSPTVDGAVDLSWAPVAGATRFRLEVRVAQGQWRSAAQQPTEGAVRLSFAGTPEVQYSFRVVALSDDAPASPPSNTVTLVTGRLSPAVPSRITATPDADVNGQIEFEWPATARAESFDLEVAHDAGFGDLDGRQVQVAGRSYTRTFPSTAGRYTERYARVRAQRITAGGVLESGWAEVAFTPEWVALPQVEGVRAANIGGVRGMFWDWPLVAGGFPYRYRGNPSWAWRLAMGTDADGSQDWFGVNILPAGARPEVPFRAFPPNVADGATRWFQVRARHRDAAPVIEGDWSAPVRVTVRRT